VLFRIFQETTKETSSPNTLCVVPGTYDPSLLEKVKYFYVTSAKLYHYPHPQENCEVPGEGGQVHVFGQRVEAIATPASRKMDQTPDFAVLPVPASEFPPKELVQFWQFFWERKVALGRDAYIIY
jgi:hypothetical protein